MKTADPVRQANGRKSNTPWRTTYRPLSKEQKAIAEAARRQAREDERAMERWAHRDFRSG